MTLRRPTAPNQIKQIQKLTKLINESSYLFVTDNEVHTGQKLSEGEWLPRVDEFISDPISGIPDTDYDRMYTRALLTKRFSQYLDKTVVEKFTRCLIDPTPADPKQVAINNLIKTFKRKK